MIGNLYVAGAVVAQDVSKGLEYCEIAAKKGSVQAHQYLALFHERNGNIQLCIKHLRVAADAGDKETMDTVMAFYKAKELSKEELTQTLRAFQNSSSEMKSKDRDEARTARDNKLR